MERVATELQAFVSQRKGGVKHDPTLCKPWRAGSEKKRGGAKREVVIGGKVAIGTLREEAKVLHKLPKQSEQISFDCLVKRSYTLSGVCGPKSRFALGGGVRLFGHCLLLMVLRIKENFLAILRVMLAISELQAQPNTKCLPITLWAGVLQQGF